MILCVRLALVSGFYILKCLLSPDVRQLATASADKTVKLWNLDGFALDRTLTGAAPLHLSDVSCAPLKTSAESPGVLSL